MIEWLEFKYFSSACTMIKARQYSIENLLKIEYVTANEVITH